MSLRARLVESRELAPDVRHFVFETSAPMRFPAGQFVSLTAPIGEKIITRAYSLAAKSNGNRFELCLNRVEGGLFSPHLFDLRPGGEVEWTGPLGYFVWRKPVRDAVLVATGTGIAPFRGMLQELWDGEGPGGQVTLVFGVRYEASLYYREEFEALAAEHAEFRFWPVLSRPGDEWTGRKGHVQPHVLEAVGNRQDGTYDDVAVYICGMKAMVDDLRAQLKAGGLDRKRLIYEKYD